MHFAGSMPLRVEDGRQLVPDYRDLSFVLDELREDLRARAFSALLPDALDQPVPQLRIPDGRDDILYPERVIPKLQRFHLAKLGQGLPVAAHGGQRAVLARAIAQAAI